MREPHDVAKAVVRWKLGRGGTVGGSGFRDPDAGGTTVALCVYDASAAAPRVALVVPGGGTCGRKPCWRLLADGGHRYKNQAGTADGVTDVKLRVTAEGEARIVVRAKGDRVPMGPLGFAAPITTQLLVTDGTGEACWQAVFSTTLRNDGRQLRAKSP
jgi:hypothetical protein